MTNQRFQLSALPGLAAVLSEEIRERLGAAAKFEVAGRVRNAELLELQYDGDPRQLRELRVAEDVFVVLGRVKMTGRAADTKAVASAPLWGGPLRQALATWSGVTGQPLVKRLTWRVVVQADDVAWRQYRRQELTLAAERGLVNAGASWRINREAAPLELWLWQVDRELVAALRLTTNVERQHGGRAVEREAALRPSVAAAMVRLSEPADDDVFLDPMCGSGTILLERAVSGRYELLLGGDNDARAVEATLANFGPRHQPRRVEKWDARRLPLDDDSVTRIACNLPWGRQIGEKAAMPRLYGELLPEFARVLIPGGRMVLLTSEWDALKAAIKQVPGVKLERTISNVEILGRRADIFVVTK